MLDHQDDDLIWTPRIVGSEVALLGATGVVFLGIGIYLAYLWAQFPILFSIGVVVAGVGLYVGLLLWRRRFGRSRIVVDRDGKTQLYKRVGKQWRLTRAMEIDKEKDARVVVRLRWPLASVEIEQEGKAFGLSRSSGPRSLWPGAFAAARHLGVGLRWELNGPSCILSAEDLTNPLIERLPDVLPGDRRAASKKIAHEKAEHIQEIRCRPTGFSSLGSWFWALPAAGAFLATSGELVDMIQGEFTYSLSSGLTLLGFGISMLLLLIYAIIENLFSRTKIDLDAQAVTLQVARLGMGRAHRIPFDELHEVAVVDAAILKNGVDRHLRLISPAGLFQIAKGHTLSDLEHIRDLILEHMRQVRGPDGSVP